MAGAPSVMLLHQNRILRECLVSVLRQSGGMEAAELDHGDPQLLPRLTQFPPRTILVSAGLPDGQVTEIIRIVRHTSIPTKVIVLIKDLNERILTDCVMAGADGYVTEDSTLAELQSAIKQVSLGNRFCSPKIAYSIVDCVARMGHGSNGRYGRQHSALTHRESEILQLVADGLTNKQIAKQLCLSLFTVKNHLHRIFEKLDVGNRFEAVRRARSHDWMIPTA